MMEKLFCRECGTELKVEADFCGECGTKIKPRQNLSKPSRDRIKKQINNPKRRQWFLFLIVLIIALASYNILSFTLSDSLPITAISYSADNSQLMSVGEDGYLQSWNVTSGKRIKRQEIPGDWGTTNAIAWAPNNQFIALARTYPDKDNEIQLFNSKDLTITSSISAGSDLIAALCIDPDGNTLYSVTHRLGIGVWNIEKEQRVGGLNDLPRRHVSHAQFDRHCQRIATIEGITSQKDSYDTINKKLIIYQRINMETLVEVPFSEDSLEHPDRLGLSPDGKTIITVKRNEKRIKTRNIDTGKIKEVSLENVGDPRSLAMGTNGYLAIGGWDGLINIYDGEGIALQTLRPGSNMWLTFQAFLE